FGKLIELIQPGGRLAFFGATAGNPPGIDLRKIFYRQITILGSTMGSPADFAGMVAMVEQHKIVPVVERNFPLSETEAALRLMESGSQFGKITISIST